MFVVGNLIEALAVLVHAVFQIYWWILFARIVLSWVNPNPANDVVRSLLFFVYRVTDPVMNRVRNMMPFLVVGGMDLSPIALFLAIGFLDQFLYRTLLDLAGTLR